MPFGRKLGQPRRAEEHGRRREDPEHRPDDVGIAGADPAAVLDGDGLVQAPGLLELLPVGDASPWGCWRSAARAARGGEQDAVDDDRDAEQDGDGLDHSSDDVLRHRSDRLPLNVLHRAPSRHRISGL